MALIFRIERNGVGPYWSDKGIKYIFDWLGDDSPSDRHPLPNEDSLLVSKAKEKGYNLETYDGCRLFAYGFKSIEVLRNWFYNDEVLLNLANGGFTIRVYMGEIIHGHTQSILRKGTGAFIEEIKIESIL